MKLEIVTTSANLPTTNQPTTFITVSDTLADELNRIEKEMYVAKAANEFVMYRIYRIRTNELWKQSYPTYTDFCADMLEKHGISGMTIHTRNTAYRALEWAGYTPDESIKMMIESPYLYSKTIENLVKFPNTINSEPVLLANVEGKEEIKEIIGNVSEMTVRDAIAYVRENYTLTPTMRAYMRENKVVVEYTTYKLNKLGEPEIDLCECITFFPDKEYTNDVYSALNTAIGRIGR